MVVFRGKVREGGVKYGKLWLPILAQWVHARTYQIRLSLLKNLVIIVSAGHSVRFPQIFQPFVGFAMVAVKFMQISVEYAEITVYGERF